MIVWLSTFLVLSAGIFPQLLLTDHDQEQTENLRDHLDLLAKNNTSFTMEVSNITSVPSKLVCQTYMPQFWITGFFTVKEYHQTIDSVSHTFDGIPAGMPIRCVFYSGDTFLADEYIFNMNGSQEFVQHSWLNFSMEQDWDGLWVNWNSSHDDEMSFQWIRLELRQSGTEDPKNGGTSKRGVHEEGRFYIGGIASGDWFVSLIAMTYDGMLTEMEWFSFTDPSSPCGEKGDPECPSEVRIKRVNPF